MGVCRTHESGVPRGRHWTVKTRAAPGAGLVAMRQGVDMTTSHRNRTVLNHDSATDGSPHDEHDAEARRSGGTGDIFPCGAHADAVGAVLARQALEGAPAGVIGSLVRVGAFWSGVGALRRSARCSEDRRRARAGDDRGSAARPRSASGWHRVASGRMLGCPGTGARLGRATTGPCEGSGHPGSGGGVRPDVSDRRRRIVASTAEGAGYPPWRRWRGRCACAFDRSIL